MRHARSKLLKIKIVSLVQEVRTIQKEEAIAVKTKQIGLAREMKDHRKVVIRYESRHTLLAYGFLRGLTYRRIEARSRTQPDWEKVKRMIRSYADNDRRITDQEFDAWRAEPEIPRPSLFQVWNAA